MEKKKTTGKILILLAAFCLLVMLPAAEGCDQFFPMPDPGGNMPDGGPPPKGGGAGDYAAFVVTTDYSITSGYAVIDLDTRQPYLPDPVEAAQLVSPDAVVTAFGDYIFIINRLMYDNITVLDKNYNMVNQYSVADSGCPMPNPHDLAFVSEDKAYLSRYGCTDLWALNPVTGQKLGTIDIPPEYIDSDGIPEASGLLLHGATLYVAVQKLSRNSGAANTWPPTDNSLLLMVDTAADMVVAEIVLTGKNPISGPIYSPELDRIVVGDVGSYWAENLEGGIEVVNQYTMTSEGYLIDEPAMGGQLGDFVIASATRGYFTMTSFSPFQSFLYGFDITTGTRDPAPAYSSPKDFAMFDIDINDRGEIYICDQRATDPGVAIIDTLAGDALVSGGRISTWLPPFALVFLE